MAQQDPPIKESRYKVSPNTFITKEIKQPYTSRRHSSVYVANVPRQIFHGKCVWTGAHNPTMDKKLIITIIVVIWK